MKILDTAKHLVSEGDEFLSQSHSSFHQKAAALLTESRLHESFKLDDLLTLALDQNIPDQNFKFLEFSDLPLTIARGKHCFIDLYLWRRRPTTIQNHHFHGAFQCLYGDNIDTTYNFQPEKSLSRIHTLGILEKISERIIRPGDVEAIDLQDKFIHQNYHLSDLTVNLCFRTIDQKGIRLSSFLHSGLKCEKDETVLRLTETVFRCSQISDLKLEDLKIDSETMIAFMIENYQRSGCEKLLRYFNDEMKKKSGVDVLELIQLHEKLLDQKENQLY